MMMHGDHVYGDHDCNHDDNQDDDHDGKYYQMGKKHHNAAFYDL